MLNTGKYDAICGVRNTWAIFSFLLPILPAQAESFAFLYNFMEMWFFSRHTVKKPPSAPVDTPGPPALLILFFFLFQDDTDYKDFLDLR